MYVYVYMRVIKKVNTVWLYRKIKQLKIETKFNVPLIQPPSCFSTQSPPAFRHLPLPVTSFVCLRHGPPPPVHITNAWLHPSLCYCLWSVCFLQCWRKNENPLGPSLDCMVDDLCEHYAPTICTFWMTFMYVSVCVCVLQQLLQLLFSVHNSICYTYIHIYITHRSFQLHCYMQEMFSNCFEQLCASWRHSVEAWNM